MISSNEIILWSFKMFEISLTLAKLDSLAFNYCCV